MEAGSKCKQKTEQASRCLRHPTGEQLTASERGRNASTRSLWQPFTGDDPTWREVTPHPASLEGWKGVLLHIHIHLSRETITTSSALLASS